MQYVKISLPTWRKIERIIKEYDRLDIGRTQGAAYGSDETVLIRNDTAVMFERFFVMQINGVVVTPETSLQDFHQRPVFTGGIPEEASQTTGRLVICAEPIGPGQIGRAWADGIVMTRIDVSEESHAYATSNPDDHTKLISGEEGLFCILYKPPGTGLQWAVVRIGSGGGASLLRWAFLKEENTFTNWKAYLDKNLTGEVVTVEFILTGGATNTTNGHYTLSAGLPVPVMKLNDQWRCLYPLQGVDVCTPTA